MVAASAEMLNSGRVSSADLTTSSATSGVAKDEAKGSSLVDVTSLSAASGAIAQALQGSDVRTEKVAALQQTIAVGTYNVPASDVATKLMSTLLE